MAHATSHAKPLTVVKPPMKPPPHRCSRMRLRCGTPSGMPRSSWSQSRANSMPIANAPTTFTATRDVHAGAPASAKSHSQLPRAALPISPPANAASASFHGESGIMSFAPFMAKPR